MKRNISINEIGNWLENPSGEQLQSTEIALNTFSKSIAIEPSPLIKDKILSTLSELNRKRRDQGVIDLKNPPLISEDSNLFDWLMATKEIKAPEDFKEIHLEPIKSSENVQMFIAWVSEMVPEEVHHDLLESFMILEGSCTCHIKDEHGNLRIVHMQAGDFISMKLGETHDIKITSEKPAKAILQWVKLAA